MKHILIAFLVLLVGSAHAQSLGRLPGTVYPADRGSRTEDTLLAVQTDLGSKGAEWLIDGNWVIDGHHFTFRSNDVVRMLPGSRFTVATGYQLDFGAAEFWAAREQCIYSTGGTIVGGKYPHLFTEWGSLTNKGYLDAPYSFSDIYSSTNLTSLGGDTNLLGHLVSLNAHVAGRDAYATTNQLNTLYGQLTNADIAISSNITSTVSNAMATATNQLASVSNAMELVVMAANFTPQAFGTGGNIIFTGWTVTLTNGPGFDPASGIYTVPQNGYYFVSASAYGINNSDNSNMPPRDFMISVAGGKTAYISTKDDSNGSGYSVNLGSHFLSGQLLSVAMYHESAIKWTNSAAYLTIMRKR